MVNAPSCPGLIARRRIALDLLKVPESSVRFSIAPALQKIVNGRRALDIAGFLAESLTAERCGWFAAYTGEKHTGDTSYTTNPILTCALGLAKTERLTFATGVSVLPVHHPVALAEDACLLDGMFPGRFRLTTGAGYFSGDYEPFGVSLDERQLRMDVGMDVIAAHRAGKPMDVPHPWAGKVPPRDPALGKDRLEVFIGAWSPAGVRRAARDADGWVTDPIRSGRWIQRLTDVYREECAKLGKAPRIVLFREAWIDKSDAAARETYGPHVLGYSRVYFVRGNAFNERYDPWLKNVKSPEQLTLDNVLEDRVLCGSAQTWVDQIGRWKEALQPEEMLIRMRHYQGPELARTLEAIERVTADVIPQLR
ncbi:MAG: LLM class flavin-dependent oxidoreductase [Betaproteobacteria bacterium]|nr:LLM class flavin-dependent oxidoreductase [Betaproteobacteria bacterium]